MSKELGKFDAEYLNLKGLNVNNRFIVDEQGNVTIRGGSISWGSVTGTTEIDNRISSAQSTANNAQDSADSAASIARRIANGEYSGTFIDGKKLISPKIYTNMLEVTVPDGYSGVAGLLLSGYIDGRQYDMLKIDNLQEYINFTSPAGAYANWYIRTSFRNNVEFYNDVEFHGKVSGVTATFG